jgi:hypothetical protein
VRLARRIQVNTYWNVVGGAVAYICDQKILALWAINEANNAWVWVASLGWRKLDPTSSTNLLIEAAQAKADGSLIDFVDEKHGEIHYIKELYVWDPGPMPAGVEVTRAVAECVFGWTSRYRQEGTHVIVKIELVKDANVSKADLDTAKDRWKKGIEEKWSYGFACCTETRATRASDCSRPCELTFEVQWVTGGAHHTVTVHNGSGRADMLDWFVTDSGDVAAHEFGHMLGNVDEYADPQCPNRNPVNTGTIMDNLDGVVARLVSRHCDALGETTVSV